MSVTALITGGNGFIGSHLVEGLSKKGYHLRILLRKTSNTAWIDSFRNSFVFGDICSADSLREAVEGVDMVFHLAGLTKARTQKQYFRANGEGVRNLLQACARWNPELQRFTLMSSLAAAGPSQSDQPLDESQPPRPVTYYGKSKLEGERFAAQYKDQFPVIILRPTAVYGPREKDLYQFFKIVNKGLCPKFSGGERFYSFIHVADLVEATIKASGSDLPSGSTFFLAGEGLWSWDAVLKLIQEGIGKKGISITIPLTLLYAAAGFCEIWGAVTRSATVLNLQKIREIKAHRWICSTERASEMFGFSPEIALPAGLQETIQWYRKKGWL